MALAGLVCLPKAEMGATLLQDYQEKPIFQGVADNGRLVRFYATTEGETWTMTEITPDGLACVIYAGQQWRSKPDKEVIQ